MKIVTRQQRQDSQDKISDVFKGKRKGTLGTNGLINRETNRSYDKNFKKTFFHTYKTKQ